MQSGSVGARPGAGVTELMRTESPYWDDVSTRTTDRHRGKAGMPLEEAVERRIIPEKYKTFRQFSRGFCIGRTVEQFYPSGPASPATC